MALEYKIQAAQAALSHIKDGMIVGLGSGSTAEEFVKLLAQHVAEGLSVTGVPTSQCTKQLAQSLHIPVTTLDEHPILDLTVDGADEIDPDLQLIKGGGGAHLREKIVAYASKYVVVIADYTKVVETLGIFPLPLEIVPFGFQSIKQAIEDICFQKYNMSGKLLQRMQNSEPYITDNGNFIVDASFGHIWDPKGLAKDLKTIPGLVEHGLFINMVDIVYVAGSDGLKSLKRKDIQ